MTFDIITLFPDMFRGSFDMSMLWKAQKNGIVEYKLINLRDFGLGPRKTVDDTPYGGGAGMVLKPEPVFAAVEAAKKEHPGSKVVVLTPSGEKYNQKTALKFSKLSGLILICGHYEGYDERILSLADYQISIGDYVLTGGEIPAMAVVDSVVRLIPGVLGDEDSPVNESFQDGLLEYPQYTRPADFKGMKVPEILQNGHHGEIAKWRKEQSLKKTKKNRPDLLENK
jgi:tRNA (guanine37-N1)-methyltransferase